MASRVDLIWIKLHVVIKARWTTSKVLKLPELQGLGKNRIMGFEERPFGSGEREPDRPEGGGIFGPTGPNPIYHRVD